MKNEEEENKKKEEEKKKLDQLNNFPGEKLQTPEISPEKKEERLFLSGLLFEQTEQFTEQDRKRKRKREKELRESQIVEFADGRKISVKEIHKFFMVNRQPYTALFPNDNEFFSEMFRLNWPDKDPKKYRKPYMASRYILQVIYSRFEQEVLPFLENINPIIHGGFRRFKHFQYLNAEGQKMVIQFRDEAIELMKTCADMDWYGFMKKYSIKYNLPFQRNLFDMED